MFERFTDRARRVVVLAQEESRLLNHNYIGTEHLLLALVHEGEGVAARALEELGVSLEAVRANVEDIVARGGSSPRGHIPFTPRAKKVLELSLREALQLGHNYVGTEHILLGLVREGEGVAAKVLVQLGADLERVRHEVINLLSGYSIPPSEGLEDVADPPMRIEVLDDGVAVIVADPALRDRLAAALGDETVVPGDHPAATSFPRLWQALQRDLADVAWRLERDAVGSWRPPEWDEPWNVAAFAVVQQPGGMASLFKVAPGVDTEEARAGLARWLTAHQPKDEGSHTYLSIVVRTGDGGDRAYELSLGDRPGWPRTESQFLAARAILDLTAERRRGRG